MPLKLTCVNALLTRIYICVCVCVCVCVCIYIFTQRKYIYTAQIYTAQIFCLTLGLARSWRNGDAQCCQLSDIADPFSKKKFPSKKAAKPYFVSETRRYCHVSVRSCFPSTRTYLSLSVHLLCSVSGGEEQRFQLNTDIYVYICCLYI